MKTIRETIEQFEQRLNALYEANELKAVTLFVLSELTGKNNAQLKAFPEVELTALKSNQIQVVLDKLSTGLPVQYAVGRTEFYGLPFEVTPDVLIPRPETEELVEWVLSEAVNRQYQNLNLIDIGTGSGCIAIALQKNLPKANAFAIDISEKALSVARGNALLNQVPINFFCADILNSTYQPENKFDIVVSNPPYVTQQDKQQMHNRVTDFEPHTALFVPEDNPLIFYKAIVEFAKEHLVSNGLLFFEINESLGQETVQILKDKGFSNIELRKDIQGKDRMIKAGR